MSKGSLSPTSRANADRMIVVYSVSQCHTWQERTSQTLFVCAGFCLHASLGENSSAGNSIQQSGPVYGSSSAIQRRTRLMTPVLTERDAAVRHAPHTHKPLSIWSGDKQGKHVHKFLVAEEIWMLKRKYQKMNFQFEWSNWNIKLRSNLYILLVQNQWSFVNCWTSFYPSVNLPFWPSDQTTYSYYTQCILPQMQH